MRIDFGVKIIAIWSAAALMLIALFTLALLAGEAGYDNLMMAAARFGAPELSPEKLEEFAEEEFLLTYEIRSPATAEAIRSKHSAVLVGTNHNYSGVMRYALLDGGFFTKEAMESKSKYVVLNETAAFEMFGSNRVTGSTLRINGETWIIAGVVQDNDEENANLYAPASVTGGQANAVMVLMDDTVTEAYAKNALKSIGIRDNSYDFINLSKSANAFYERFAAAWKTALLLGILLVIFVAGGRLVDAIRFYRNKLRTMYLREMISSCRKDLIKAVCLAAAFATAITSAMILSLQILEALLTWQELTAITGELAAGDFGHKLLWLRNYQVLDSILFWVCAGTSVIGFLAVLLRRRGNEAARSPRYRLKAGHIGDYRIS